MGILEIIAPLLSSGTGFLASYLQKIEERKILKEKHDYELSNKKLDLEITLATLDKKAEVQDLKDRGESFTVSQENTGPKMDFVRACVRPFITLYLLLASTWVTYICYSLVGKETLDTAFAQDIFSYALTSLVSLNITVISWWFGTRPAGAISLFNRKTK